VLHSMCDGFWGRFIAMVRVGKMGIQPHNTCAALWKVRACEIEMLGEIGR
jgi:hypothetical protein